MALFVRPVSRGAMLHMVSSAACAIPAVAAIDARGAARCAAAAFVDLDVYLLEEIRIQIRRQEPDGGCMCHMLGKQRG